MLRLRPFRTGDEVAALRAHEALKSDAFMFLLDYTEGENWDGYVKIRQENQRGRELPYGWVPSALLAAVVGDELVGRVSVRYELNDWLSAYGGHIGYAVVPEHRRKGYATEILRQSLIVARSVGVDDVLVACAVENVASAKTIEACGGEFESEADGDRPGSRIRRYWIR